MIDVSTADVYNRKQRLQFRYRKGIRPACQRTEKDPFYNPKTNRRTLRPAEREP